MGIFVRDIIWPRTLSVENIVALGTLLGLTLDTLLNCISIADDAAWHDLLTSAVSELIRDAVSLLDFRLLLHLFCFVYESLRLCFAVVSQLAASFVASVL